MPQVLQGKDKLVSTSSKPAPKFEMPAVNVNGVREALNWYRATTDSLEQTYGRMNNLCALTKSVVGMTMYLCVLKRPEKYGAVLGWRTTKHSHLNMEKADKLIDQMPGGMRAWYQNISRETKFLNLQERVARNNLKHAKQALEIFGVDVNDLHN